jgi:hypothetical protein
MVRSLRHIVFSCRGVACMQSSTHPRVGHEEVCRGLSVGDHAVIQVDGGPDFAASKSKSPELALSICEFGDYGPVK